MPAVLSLIKELAVFEKEPNAVVVTVDDLERDGFGASPLFHTFVAEVNNKIVGMALYYYRYSTWKGKTIHLEDLIIKEQMRGTGVRFCTIYRNYPAGQEGQRPENRMECTRLEHACN